MTKIMNLPLSVFLFLVSRGIAIPVAITFTPPLIENLYLAFVQDFIRRPSLDPWSEISQNGLGSSPTDAFPYGWPLVLIMALFVALFGALGNASMGILALYILVDTAVLLLLLRLDAKAKLPPSLVYALSPAPPIALALVGANDFIPMLAILVGVIAVTRGRPLVAGTAFGIAVGTKAILVVALIAAILFLYRELRDATKLLKLGSVAFATAFLSLSPAVYSAGFREALTTSQSAISTFSSGLIFDQRSLLFAPLVVGLSLFVFLQLKRLNHELLMLIVATPLYLLAGLPHAPLGWYLWALPLLSILIGSLPARFLFVFITGFILNTIGNRTGNIFQETPAPLQGILYDSSFTLGFLANVVLVGLLWREFFIRSDFVKLREKPALVLIAGDSGTGKDTLAEGLSRCLGRKESVHVSGDDYHLWDRANGTWRFLTHLNPEANDLAGYFQGIMTLVSGKSISVRRYDHRLGRRLSPETAQSREFVISSGLHALWSSDLNSMASLSVFLEMEDDLRLDRKISRDTIDRMQSRESILKSIEVRRGDYEKYLARQKDIADLVVRSEFAHTKTSPGRAIWVEFLSQPKTFDSRLMSELVHTCGLEALYSYGADGKRSIRVTGDFSPSVLNTALQRMEPDVSEVLSPEERWSDGPPGIVQFITILYLFDSLRRERLIR